jgi:SAM-dependent methyltransferase
MNEAKFSGMGTIYAKSRPSYPQEFIDYLYSDVGITADSVVADIGSGTGILTRQLLERGSKVFAVEPNADMRASADLYLGGFSKYVSVDGAAENTTLDGNSIDFVTVATAFHWFDRKAFQAECRRILKTGGKVVIVYNSRDEDSDFVKKLYEVSATYCPNFVNHPRSGALLRPEYAGFYRDFFADDYREKIINNDLIYDEQGFVGRSLSSSYAVKEDHPNYAAYVAALKALFQQHSKNDVLTMPNVTHSYVGTV